MNRNNYEERMKEIFLFENIDLDKAVEKFREMSKDFPEDNVDILYELSKMYFRHEYYLKALRGFISCYKFTKSEEILLFILDCYYNPNTDEYKMNIEENKKMLLEYPYYYGEIKEIFEEVKVVWTDEATLIYFYKEEFISRDAFGVRLDQSTQQGRFVLVNEISTDLILNMLGNITPNYVYLYFDELVFAAFLQCNRLEEIILKRQIIFIIGDKKLQEFFMDYQMPTPVKLFAITEDGIMV